MCSDGGAASSAQEDQACSWEQPCSAVRSLVAEEPDLCAACSGELLMTRPHPLGLCWCLLNGISSMKG